MNYNNSLDNSNTFSIKGENLIQELSNENSFLNNHSKIKIDKSFNLNNIESNTENYKKIIVYKIEQNFLIPMFLIDDKNLSENLIKLKYPDNESVIILKKEDIYYEPISTFKLYGNLAELDFINDLTILKNIHFKMTNNRPYIYLKDILYLFNLNDNYNNNKERDFFFYEFIKESDINKNIFLINCDSSEIILQNIITFIKGKNLKNEKKIFNCLINILSKISNKFLFLFNNKGLNILPIFSTNIKKNDLYNEHIFFYNNSTKIIIIKKDINNKLNLDKEILKKILDNENIKQIFNKIIMIKENNIKFLNILNNFYIDDNENNYENLIYNIKLFILSYIFYSYKKLAKEYISNSNYSKNDIMMKIKVFVNIVKEKNLLFYSNLIFLCLIHNLTLFYNKKYYSNNKNNFHNEYFIFFNKFLKDEDEKLLNESILRTIKNNLNNIKKDNNSIYNYIKYYYEENINNFENELLKNDKILSDIIENNFNLTDKNKNENFLIIFKNNFNNLLYYLKNFDASEKKINFKLIKNYNFNKPNFDLFLKNQDKLYLFFNKNQFSEYYNLFKNLNYNNNNNFFRVYTFKNFFDFFLPILSDIDKKYNPSKYLSYKKQLINFIQDLQNYQEINEPFYVDNNYIKINYNTFEILMFLLFNIKEEKISIIQHLILKTSKKKQKFIDLINKTKLIQKNFKKYIFKKYLKNNNNDLIDLIIRKYKGNDPILIRLIINSQKNLDNLIKENKELKTKLNNCSNQNSVKKKNNNSFNNNITNNSINNSNKSNNNDLNSLQNKLNEARNKYKELVGVLIEYEKRMKNFIELINNNDEVKEILMKNGVELN